MRISDWSSDVCSSDLFDINADWVDYAAAGASGAEDITARLIEVLAVVELKGDVYRFGLTGSIDPAQRPEVAEAILRARAALIGRLQESGQDDLVVRFAADSYNHNASIAENRSEEHTSELQSLMRISYAVFCLKKKKDHKTNKEK